MLVKKKRYRLLKVVLDNFLSLIWNKVVIYYKRREYLRVIFLYKIICIVLEVFLYYNNFVINNKYD